MKIPKIKMSNFALLIVAAAIFSFSSITCAQKNDDMQKNDNIQKKVLISTTFGDIKVLLYNETPLHRDNFIKLTEEGFYNGSIFHRVINTFMIQGGGGPDGTTDAGYTVKAEILNEFCHKKGALSAARMPDQINPQKESSGSQFYLVQGTVMTEYQISQVEQQKGIKYTKEQKDAYTTIGGTPHLDRDYTVFGEVYEGLDVIDKIAAVPTSGRHNRPKEDVIMQVKIIQ